MILKKKQDSKANRKHKGQEGLFQSSRPYSFPSVGDGIL